MCSKTYSKSKFLHISRNRWVNKFHECRVKAKLPPYNHFRHQRLRQYKYVVDHTLRISDLTWPLKKKRVKSFKDSILRRRRRKEKQLNFGLQGNWRRFMGKKKKKKRTRMSILWHMTFVHTAVAMHIRSQYDKKPPWEKLSTQPVGPSSLKSLNIPRRGW